MDHIAVDLGGRKSYVVVRDQSGKVLERLSVETDALEGFLKKKAPGRVVMETCAEAFSVADQALAVGHEVRVIPSSQVRALGIGSHGIKTDRRDAEVLSDVSTKVDLKGVHIPSSEARVLKAKLAARDALVTSKVALLNTIRGILRCTRTRVRASTAKAFAKRVRAVFADRKEQTPSELERLLICLLVLDEQLETATDELDK